MNTFRKIEFLLDKKDKLYLILISTANIVGIFFEMLSLSIIIPVFGIIFLQDSSVGIFSRYININFINSDYVKISLLLLLLTLFFLKNLYLLCINYLSIKYYNLLSLKLSTNLFQLYLNKNYSFFISEKSEFFTRKLINDINGTKAFLNCCQNLIIDILLALGLIIILAFSNFRLFLFFSSIFLTVLFLYYKIVKEKIKSWSYLYQEHLGKLQNTITEFSAGIKDIIIYNLGSEFEKKFSFSNSNAVKSLLKIDFISNVQRFWMEVVAIAAIIFPLIIFLFMHRPIANLIPSFALLAAILFKIVPCINRMIANVQFIKFNKPCFDLVYKELSDTKQKQFILISNNFEFKNCIEFKNVAFSYRSKDLSIFDNLNFKILKGESVAILGENGSGKSTLLNLFSGLIEPTQGQIIVDNNFDISKFRKSWLNNISYVQQNIFLQNNTIKRNIILKDNIISDYSRYDQIIKLLNLEEIFKNFPNGLNTNVNSEQSNLSGGQKQLISIARALYKDTDIIIFDEANSALDFNYLNILKNLLKKLKKQKTIILVTHEKLLLNDSFDKILRIDSGHIVSQT